MQRSASASPPITDSSPASPQPFSDERIPVLDGLRGLAILLVLLAHFTPHAQGASVAGKAFFGVTNMGWIGVDLFFVLSGFLITGILYDAKGSEHYFRNFYMRRLLRIFPLYYGCLVAIFLVLPLFLPRTDDMQRLIDAQGWLWAHCANILLALRGDWHLHTEHLNLHHFWSLAVEEHFYLFWPFIVALFARRTLIGIAVVLSIIALALRSWLYFRTGNDVALYVLTPCRMDQLLAGAIVALVARAPGGMTVMSRHAVWIFAVCAVVAVTTHAIDRFEPATETIGYTAWAGLFASLLVLVVTFERNRFVAAAFANSWIRFFGKYSYGMYVLHALFIMPYIERTDLRSRLSDQTGSTALGVLLTLLIGVAATVLASLLSWHLFEKHFLKLKRFFDYDRRNATDAPPALVGVSGDAAGLNRDRPPATLPPTTATIIGRQA